MTFLDPVFLWGLGAIAVPLVLHLLLRRRVPVLDFPLARLVARAERGRSPRRRLNRVLLLLTRALLLALLAFALARLTLGGSPVHAAGPVAAVVVVDDSLSMQAVSSDGASAIERGRRDAALLLDGLPEGSRAGVVVASDPARGEAEGLLEPAEARARVEAAAATFRRVDPRAALEAAARMLDSSALADRRLVVVADLQRTSWSVEPLPRPDGTKPRLHLVVPERPDVANASVAGLDAVEQPGGRLRVAARIADWGGDAAGRAIDLELHLAPLGGAGRLAGRGRVVAGPGATVERRFDVESPPEGLGASEIRIAPGDALAADDVRAAVHAVARRPRVLLVDGDPQNLSYGSETFYAEKALAPGVGLELDADITTIADLAPDDVRDRAAILLANVPDLTEEDARAVEEAVRGGAGLVIALGNRVDQRAWNGRLAPLVPATLGTTRQAPPPGAPAAVPGVATGFHVKAWQALEPDEGAAVLARLPDGSPLLVAGELGEGSVLVFAATLDRDWTDLPINPAYLAFLRHVIERVVPTRGGVALPPVLAGEPLDLVPLELGPGARVVAPGGVREDVPAGEPFTATTRLGPHAVEDGGEVVAAFAVVADPLESDLTRLSLEDAAARLSGMTDAASLAGVGGESAGRPAWKVLLVALVLLAALEAFLARRAA